MGKSHRERVLSAYAEVRKVITMHHLANTLLTISFYMLKCFPSICERLFRTCYLDNREFELYCFCILISMIKNRRATSWLHYLATFFLFMKFANLFLFYRANPKLALVYGVCMLLQAVLLPEPTYIGNEIVTYFRASALQDELSSRPDTVWIVEFYASWAPPCLRLHPVFAQLSREFTLSNLKFGKMDVSRYASEAKHFGVDISATSQQLPTMVLFKNGKEVLRRPFVDRKARVVRYVFKYENILHDFDLNNVYRECMERQPKKKVEKKKEQ